ncbi:MAG: hypothetical protein KDA33_08350 [Phycisphaerales bacterium]|nr:hypothetical protein [Phycisphaerales bacterium]
MNRLCIRHETKSPWERRAPLAPADVAALINSCNLRIAIEPSSQRVFEDTAYTDLGAESLADANAADIVLGVKEIPIESFAAGRTYCIFSHTIKGQPANMPVLARLIELGCTLIDYELITNDEGRRLVAFGPFAGVAGMIDSLWSLGRRLDAEGIATPFSDIRPAHQYEDIEEAKQAILAAGRRIQADALPAGLAPCVVGVTGYGAVSRGAQMMLDLLPVQSIAPDDLGRLHETGGDPRHIYKCVFHEEHLVERAADGGFELREYYDQPDRYRSTFASRLSQLTMLVNCIYWEPKYPRLATRQDFEGLYADGGQPRLRVVGDITCDIDGSLACTTHATTPEDPVYVFDPSTGRTRAGVEGRGPVVLAVDFLPCEVSYDATVAFSLALTPFMPGLAGADFSRPLEQAGLPPELERAVIVYRGRLTERFAHLADCL